MMDTPHSQSAVACPGCSGHKDGWIPTESHLFIFSKGFFQGADMFFSQNMPEIVLSVKIARSQFH